MPWAGLRLKNRPLSLRMHKEKCRPFVRLTSSAPVFANGAVTAAMAFAFNQVATEGANGESSGTEQAEEEIMEFGEFECGVNLNCGMPPIGGPIRAAKFTFEALKRIRAALSVNATTRAVNVLRPQGKLIGEAGSSSAIRILRGGETEARALFQQLSRGGKVVEGTNFPGQLVRLRGGGQIGFRPVSTSGPPTIDVTIKGLGVREIKFLP